MSLLGSQTIQENTILNSGRSFLSRENPYPNKISTSKYTILTFLPMNFIHQISKGSTFFFFFTMILLLIPKINPFEPYSYILAFSIIVGVSMIKDAMSDYKRHKSDDIVNKTIVKTVEYSDEETDKPKFTIKEKYCMELKKGDYLLVEKNDEVQADVILLQSIAYHKNNLECTSHCFIQTTNIDGESNLKKRNALCSPKNYPCCKKSNSNTQRDPNSLCQCLEHYFKNNMSFDLKETGDSFNDFECDFNINGRLVIANERNALLRGSILKNTVKSLCLVVGVGSDTKQSKSLYKSKKSRTLFDSRMNFILIVVLLIYAVMLGITMAVGSVFIINNQESPYLGISSIKMPIVKLLISNYVLYTYLIPLSLYVMLEVARFIHAFYVSHDIDMIAEDKTSVCRNSNVIEDLGTIDYILTDKTGTITKNEMTLKHIHKAGDGQLSSVEDLCSSVSRKLNEQHNDKSVSEALKDIIESHGSERENLMILLNMLICNSVEILNSEMQGISQEELCFLDSISSYGFELAERDEEFIILKILDEKIKINIIGTLEFTSKRQRMCVIVEILGRYFFLSKGSDLKLLDKSKDANTLKIINSSTDFRCLVMKYKEMLQEEISEFKDKSKIDLEDQTIEDQGVDIHIEDNLVQKMKQMEEESFKDIEKDTYYIGSTFIEDELQEEVEETMRTFKEANIKVWMITGDKKETSIACAKNSRIIEDDERYLAVDGKTAVEMIERQIEYEELNKKSIWKRSFRLFDRSDTDLHEDSNEQLHHSIFDKKNVIVYRATPSQKGKIAAMLVKSGRSTLSIGDGNNDLGMLRVSHVGVGIMGKEGTQAALSADFAIPQFKNLKNLLLVHGRYSFLRFTKVALNSYYKNIVFIFVQFIYNLSACASAFPLYNSFTLNYYNLFFTSMIPFSIALFDRDTNPSLALQRPATYQHVRNSFDRSFVFLNVAFAIFEATIIFFITRILISNDITNGSGILGGYTSMSTIFSMVVIFTVLLRQVRQVSYRVVFTDISIVLTVILNLISIFFIQEFYNKTKFTIYYLLTMPYFYFIIISLCSLVYTVDTLFDNFSIYLEDKIKIKA